MSDKIIYKFGEAIDDNKEYRKIESRGYKKAVKSFQNKYPKLFKEVMVEWVKNGVELIINYRNYQWAERKNWRDND